MADAALNVLRIYTTDVFKDWFTEAPRVRDSTAGSSKSRVFSNRLFRFCPAASRAENPGRAARTNEKREYGRDYRAGNAISLEFADTTPRVLEYARRRVSVAPWRNFDSLSLPIGHTQTIAKTLIARDYRGGCASHGPACNRRLAHAWSCWKTCGGVAKFAAGRLGHLKVAFHWSYVNCERADQETFSCNFSWIFRQLL